MPGRKGEITQGKRAKLAIYLGDATRMFKKTKDRIYFSNEGEIVSINKDGKITDGKKLFRILNSLYKREHKK